MRPGKPVFQPPGKKLFQESETDAFYSKKLIL
jgi:hypothetical protein